MLLSNKKGKRIKIIVQNETFEHKSFDHKDACTCEATDNLMVLACCRGVWLLWGDSWHHSLLQGQSVWTCWEDDTHRRPLLHRGWVAPGVPPPALAARFWDKFRFLTAGESGSADTVRDPRGFAVKFYTEEGNWDLTGNNTPIFFIRDAMLVGGKKKWKCGVVSRNELTRMSNMSHVAPVHCAVPVLHPHAEAKPPDPHERPRHGVGLLEPEARESASGIFCCSRTTRISIRGIVVSSFKKKKDFSYRWVVLS